MKYNSSISQKHTAGSTLVWLAYTLFFFIEPIFAPSLRLWLGTIGFFVLFLCVFLVYTRTTNETTRRAMIAATFAIGLICFPWNGGASTFFIYTAAFLPFSVEATAGVLAFFSLEAASIAAESYFFHLPWQSAAFAIFLLLVIGGGNIFFAQQRRADCKLRAAQEENVALAALAERERIARDLHDVLGHTLSVIVLKAELAGRLIERDPQRAASEITDVERTARTALAEVREAIGGYRARGLVAEIEAARRTLDAAGVTLKCDAMPSTNTGLRANEETVLALALREAVTNIVRHARATTCTLRFHMEDGQHRLTVADNGEHPATREGNGLRGMRERVEALGGRVQLDRTTGTRLLIALPAHAESNAG
jgi:two-component system, NarL family, sensor histidine kinase DesK